MATFPIFQFYVELDGYEPKMWRRFQVMNYITVAKLAYILMTLFELRKYYSYEFRKDELNIFLKKHPEYNRRPENLKDLNIKFKKLRYGITSSENIYMYRKIPGYENLQDATKVKLSDILSYENEELTFYYDPEINWKINIVLEKIYTDKQLFSKELPKVLDGEGYGIIEDLGGLEDLRKFRDELKKRRWINKTNYKYHSTIGQTPRLHFDKMNLDDMNYRIKLLPKVFQDGYEHNWYPTDKQRKILKRKYHVYKKVKKTYIKNKNIYRKK